jgi:signal transduction histidine kinase
MDKVLVSHKKDFNQSLSHLKTKAELDFFPLLNKEFILRPTDKFPIRDSIFTQYVYDSLTAEEIPHRVYRTGVIIQGKKYELTIRESMVTNIALISSILVTQLIMVGLLLVGLFVINRRLSKTIWDPFYIILDQLKKFNLDNDKEISLPISSTEEFRKLKNTITELIQKTKEVYQTQKEFTENAAHELQTPLAICRSKLELLAQTSELTEEQAGLVETLLQATDRIARLNRNLLLLSKIENRQFSEIEKIDIKTAIEKVIAIYIDQANEKKLTIESAFHTDGNINGNVVLIEVLINNIISNAIRYSPAASVIKIEASQKSLIISNAGEPVKNPEKIFTRFQRENASHSGNGLGLSIAKKVCDVSGYKIHYYYERGRHYFSVAFIDEQLQKR